MALIELQINDLIKTVFVIDVVDMARELNNSVDSLKVNHANDARILLRSCFTFNKLVPRDNSFVHSVIETSIPPFSDEDH